MRECEHFELLLHAQLDDMITDEEQRQLLAHLTSCEHCRALQQDLLELSDAMSDMHVAPPADLTANIMAAVQQEQKRAVIPIRRKRFRALVGSLAACFAVVIVAVAALYAMPKSSDSDANTSLEASTFDEQENTNEAPMTGTADTADDSEAVPETVEETEVADAVGASDAAGSTGGTASRDATSDADNSGETYTASPSPGTASAVGENNDDAASIVPSAQAPRTAITQAPESGDSANASSGTESSGATDSTVTAAPSTSEASGSTYSSSTFDSSVAESSTASVTAGTGYAKELSFTAVDSVPSFLLELGVPDISEGASSYELIVSLEECNAVELQFIANGLDYTVVPHNEESAGSTQGKINISYERTQQEESTDTSADSQISSNS